MDDPPPARGAHTRRNDSEEGRFREEQVIESAEDNNKVVIPADGYGWKKYGQKFIKNIGKTRSYFKCHKMKCKAKKRVEWSALNPENTRTIYYGKHTHTSHSLSTPHQQPSSPQDASASASASKVNHYDLYTQVFGAAGGGAQNNTNS